MSVKGHERASSRCIRTSHSLGLNFEISAMQLAPNSFDPETVALAAVAYGERDPDRLRLISLAALDA